MDHAGVVVTRIEPRPAGKAVRSISLHGVAAAVMYLTPLGLFVPAALVHSGLRNGQRGFWGSAALATAIVALVTAGGASALAPAAVPAAMASFVRFILEVTVPSSVVLAFVLRSASFGSTVVAGVGASMVGFTAGEAVTRQFFGFSAFETIVASFRTSWAQTLEFYRQANSPDEAVKLLTRTSEIIASSFMPALLVSVAALMFVFSLVLLSRLPGARSTGGRYLFRTLSFPDALLFLFIAGGIAPLASGAMRTAGLNVLAVVAFLYLLQGLAVFRFVLLRLGFGPGGNLLAWAFLGLLMLYGVAPLALFIVGLFDPFFDFRKLNRKDDSHESHTD